ncbi:MAG: replicative DNA helicase [Epsilonproteobacteria bacterium]|nr:replicative DNA helicase [Campylobacterota bacterium]
MEALLYNLDIERAVLSSIFFNPRIYEDVAGVLEPKDFFYSFYREIFQTMEELFQEDLPIAEEFVKDRLISKGKFKEDEFLEILATNPLKSTLEAYLKELKEKSTRRELVNLTSTIREMSAKEGEVLKIIDEIQSQIYRIATQTSSREFKDSKQVVKDTIQHLLRLKERKNRILIGLDTGFEELNIKTAGFNYGDLIIIAARPSMGKTAFSLNIAQAALDKGKGVVIFSLEMPAEQLMLRMMSAKASIPLQNLRTGNLEDPQWAEISRLSDYYSKKKLFIDDDGSINVHQLRAKLRKLKAQHPEIELAIVDYLQLMAGSTTKERHLEIGEISRNLKMLARELNIPIIALSQLNRSLESRINKRPLLSDLRESGAIEQDADVILFIYRDDVYKLKEEKEKFEKDKSKGELNNKPPIEEKKVEKAEIIIGKQRNGPTGVVNLYFHKEYVKFSPQESETIREDLAVDTKIEVHSYSS